MLVFPRGMQSITALTRTTAKKQIGEVTLADRDKTIYVKSLQSLRLYQQIDNEVIDEYRSRIFKHSPGVNRRIISRPPTETIMDDSFD